VDASRLAPIERAWLDRCHHALLALYRDARRLEPDAFCRAAIEHLRAVVRFDSMMWGHGHADPVSIHDVQLAGQPPEMMQSYARYQKDDFFAAACNRAPGRAVDLYDVVDRASMVKMPIHRHHASRFGMEHILCVVLPQPDSGLVSFVSLWRKDYDDPWSAADRVGLETWMPHLVEARRQNAIDWLQRVASHAGAPNGPAAVCDPRGVLHVCDEAFVENLRLHWPGWSGPKLPDALVRAIRRSASGRLDTVGAVIEWVPFEERRLLRARAASTVDRLSRRERDVAQHLIEGCTHKEIAQRLGVSPNTVRTHIYLLYKRLGVTNRAEMIATVRAGGGIDSRPVRPRRRSPATATVDPEVVASRDPIGQRPRHPRGAHGA
jgi:DNA-binding CsgD family transcriptional regulator